MFKNTPKGSSTSAGPQGNSYNARGFSSSGGGYGGRDRGKSRGGSGYSSSRGGNKSTMANTRLKGLFSDGQWHCDCSPRLPAERFRVKKEGKNQGRWFYTCQNAEPERCGFFLWQEDAAPREAAAVLDNSRSEPRGQPTTQSRGEPRAERARGVGSDVRGQGARDDDRGSMSRTMSPSSPPRYRPQTNAPGGSNATAQKRTAQEAMFDPPDSDEEPFPWSLTGQEEEELAQVIVGDQATSPVHASEVMQVETPSRKAIKTSALATPSTGTITPATATRRLPWLDYSSETTPGDQDKGSATTTINNGLPTPSTTKTTMAGDHHADTTPTPSRFTDALASPAPAPGSAALLTEEVMSLLKRTSTSLPQSVNHDLLAILSRHEMRTQGIAKGREISRVGLKAKDAKIAELSARIASLEAEREVGRSVVRKLRFEKQGGGSTAAADDDGEAEL